MIELDIFSSNMELGPDALGRGEDDVDCCRFIFSPRIFWKTTFCYSLWTDVRIQNACFSWFTLAWFNIYFFSFIVNSQKILTKAFFCPDTITPSQARGRRLQGDLHNYLWLIVLYQNSELEAFKMIVESLSWTTIFWVLNMCGHISIPWFMSSSAYTVLLLPSTLAWNWLCPAVYPEDERA